MAALSTFTDVTITRSTRTASSRGFSTALIAAYHTAYVDRVRIFSEPAEMVAAGHLEKSPEYKAAVRLKAQSPSPDSFKIGRRAGAPEQSLRFTPSAPAEGEEFTLTLSGVEFSYTALNSDTAALVLDAFVALVNVDDDAIITTRATAATIQTITGVALNGVVGAGTMAPARNVTFTLNSHADWDATSIVVTGTYNGRTITESFSVPNGGNVVLTGARLFDAITSVVVPAQTGTNGSFTMGKGKLFDVDGDLDVTATDGTTYVDIATVTAGDWFSVAASSNFAIEDRTPEPATSLAADLAAIEAADADFFGLAVADAQSAAQIAAVAAVVESSATPRLYVAHTIDTAVTEDTEDDIASTVVAAGYLNTKIFYQRRSHGLFPDAGLFGRMFGGYQPAEASIEYKAITGCLADDLSPTVLQRLVGTKTDPVGSKRVTVYIDATPAGTNVGTPITWGGLTAGGEWFDIMQGIYFTIALLQGVSFNLQISNPRIPFTSRGIKQFEGQVESVIDRVSAPPYNFLDATEEQVISATKLADTTSADRQARFYNAVRWGSKVQGAIRFGSIGGNVTP